MLSKKQQLEKENLEWFNPSFFKQYPPEEGEFEDYLAHSENGVELRGRKRGWNNFNIYSEAKRWRGITIHEMWEESFLKMDGSWPGYYYLLQEEGELGDGKPIPEHIKDFIKREIFKGIDAESIDTTYRQIKEEYEVKEKLENKKVCNRCCMDTSAPIVFDENGVCNYCHEWQEGERKRLLEKQNRPWIIHEIQKTKGKFNCLIGLSGGVDSSYALHLMMEQGLRPLCFSMDNGHNTKEADENIMQIVETLKVPFIRKVIDLKEFKELQEAFEKSNTLNIEIPTDFVIRALTYQIAKENGIKWIIGGGNHATEGILPSAWGYSARDITFVEAVFGKKLKNLSKITLLQYIWYRFVNKIKIVNFLDYYEYDRNKAIKLLQERYGFRPYGDKHGESKYTKWFQEEYLPRFGIIKDKAHYSSMINSGQMTREEALKKLEGRKVGDKKYTPHTRFRNSEHHWNMLASIYRKICKS